MENFDKDQLDNTGGVSRSKLVVRNGIAVGLVFIVLLIVTDMFREQMMELNTIFSILYMVILLIGIIVTQNQVRDQSLGGKMMFSKAFGTGMLLVFLVTAIFVVFSALFYLVIAPDTLTEAKDLVYNQMREQEMSKEEIEMAMKFTAFMYTPGGILLMSSISYIFFGTILSLVGAAITSRNK
jgi:Protein of unknown function (DUF4199)